MEQRVPKMKFRILGSCLCRLSKKGTSHYSIISSVREPFLSNTWEQRPASSSVQNMDSGKESNLFPMQPRCPPRKESYDVRRGSKNVQNILKSGSLNWYVYVYPGGVVVVSSESVLTKQDIAFKWL